MNRMIYYFFISLELMVSCAARAQTKPRYTAALEAAITKGNSDNSHAFLFTNSVAYKNWMAGVGISTDDYVFSSLPLFLDVKKSFGHRHLQPFVNASAGMNLNDAKNSQKFQYYAYPELNFKNGFYSRVMAGVSLPVYKRMRVFVSGGYSYKTTKVSYASSAYSGDIIKTTNTDIYRFNRWSFSAGFWF